jgi:hypothetical protein
VKFLKPIRSSSKLPLAPGAKHSAFYGTMLLMLWVAFWVESFGRNQLVFVREVSFPAWSFLGLDFMHNYLGARAWLSGLNPYVDDIGDARGPYAYPPVVLPMFAWCKFLSFELATVIWAAFIAGTIAWGARLVQEVRIAARLPFLSLVLATVLILWSMPAMFAMERGNGDAIVLLGMIVAVIAWRRKRSWLNDAIIGACIAVAAWVKVYPLVLFGVLVLTGRWRALLFGLGVFAAVGLIPLEYTKGFLDASRHAQGQRTDTIGAAVDWLKGLPMRKIRREYAPIEFSSHSLTSYWPWLWFSRGVMSLHRIPGLIGAAVCLFPLGAWVTWSFWRSPKREQWVFPFMLWLVTLTTFWMPVSYDYNLFFLPLVMWAVWDHRDGLMANLALAAAVLWWQPLELPGPFTPPVLFFVKLASLIAAGQALVRRLGVDSPALNRAAETAPGEATAAADALQAPAEDRVADDGKVPTDVS